MQRLTNSTRILGLMLLFALLALGASRAVGAQDATPAAAGAEAGHPAHIHEGSCAEGELGDIVAPLSNVTAPTGAAVGQASALTAETSVTTVPLALSDILAGAHAINVHLSTEEIGTYIACGEVGGTLDAAGDLVIGLRELDASGYSGIAFLSPNDADATQTDVSLFLAQGLSGGVGGTTATPMAGAEATVEGGTDVTPEVAATPAS